MSNMYYLVSANALPASAIPASAIPASAIPASAIPASALPASAIPASAIPASAIPLSALPMGAISIGASSTPEGFGEFVGRGDTIEGALGNALEKAAKSTEGDEPIITYVVQRISGEKSKERSFIQVEILAKVC